MTCKKIKSAMSKLPNKSLESNDFIVVFCQTFKELPPTSSNSSTKVKEENSSKIHLIIPMLAS